MPLPLSLLNEIVKLMEKHSFCVLTTASADGKPHAVGVIYSALRFDMYVYTLRKSKKARNIMVNPHVAVVIPIPYLLRFIPPRVIQFQGKAEILPPGDSRANQVYKWRTPKDVDACFIHIQPENKLYTHGIGMSTFERARHPEKARRTVQIP